MARGRTQLGPARRRVAGLPAGEVNMTACIWRPNLVPRLERTGARGPRFGRAAVGAGCSTAGRPFVKGGDAMPTTSALVIGGSLAGMCAARVLSDFVDRVTIVERD